MMKDRLRAVFCDHLSIMRGKYLPGSKIGDDETRFCRSVFGVHYDKDLLPAPHALRLVWDDPVTLDPAAAMGMFASEVIAQLFSGLVEQTPDMDIVPDIARTWEVLEGGRTYVFHLRDDAYWSDGTPVTAEDFACAWHRLLDPATGSRHADLLHDIKGARAFNNGQAEWQDVGVHAPDAGTLVVELQEPTGYFLQLLDYQCALPMPHHALREGALSWTDAESMVTSGPFRLESWIRGESLTLVRNPQYHGRFRGNVQRVELNLGVEPSDKLDMYTSDRLDCLDLWRIPISEMARARQRHAPRGDSTKRRQTLRRACRRP